MFGIFAALSEFERALISESARARLIAARGRRGSRRYTMTPAKVNLAMAAMSNKETVVISAESWKLRAKRSIGT